MKGVMYPYITSFFYLLFVCGLIYIIGCAFERTTNIHVNGNNVRTVYGSGDLNFDYQSNNTLKVFHK